MGPELLEFNKPLDSTLRRRISILGGPVWGQELGTMILVGPFQLGIFCASVILYSGVCSTVNGMFDTFLFTLHSTVFCLEETHGCNLATSNKFLIAFVIFAQL